jgi:hypothetical protein
VLEAIADGIDVFGSFCAPLILARTSSEWVVGRGR